ncbi:hypothetical protein DITRI_Ditri07aG0017900 [Diplodiscus trichospermus]
MASYTESTKTAEYITVPAVESPHETNIKMLSGAAIDAQTSNAVDVSSSKLKKEKKMKKKRCLFMCCSNMQFENEEEKEKALAILKSENGKLAMVMCCSNFQVGAELDFAPRKPGK